MVEIEKHSTERQSQDWGNEWRLIGWLWWMEPFAGGWKNFAVKRGSEKVNNKMSFNLIWLAGLCCTVECSTCTRGWCWFHCIFLHNEAFDIRGEAFKNNRHQLRSFQMLSPSSSTSSALGHMEKRFKVTIHGEHAPLFSIIIKHLPPPTNDRVKLKRNRARISLFLSRRWIIRANFQQKSRQAPNNAVICRAEDEVSPARELGKVFPRLLDWSKFKGNLIKCL